MKKRIVSLLLVILVSMSFAFAEDAWWVGKQINGFDVKGLYNISTMELNDVLYSYRGKAFSDELVDEIETKLKAVKGIESIEAGVAKIDDSSIRLVITVKEMPILGSIVIEGNDKVKASSIVDSIKNLKIGDYVNASDSKVFEEAKNYVSALYNSKGFDNIPVQYKTSTDEHGNVVLTITVKEGVQSRIVKVNFEGNVAVKPSVLKKQIKSKAKTLFIKGFLDPTTLKTDEICIAAYYQTLGYIDVIVTSQIKEVEGESDFRDVELTFVIDEGSQWYFGGITVTGNTIYSTERINEEMILKKGSILNLATVQADYSAVADLYYNNGYISNSIDLEEHRDDTTMTISYDLKIVEGPQAVIEKILITGLKKTDDNVMRREIELKEGEVFSKAKLITSAQNLYNTGLLKNLDYNLYYGNEENSVIIEFTVEEGSHMDIQFGATFGGSITGFPISGFLQWADHNLGGRGQELDVNTNLSPDTQSLAVTFGNDWLFGQRWSNSISLGFSHTVYDNQLRLGVGSEMYDGRNEAYPLGYFDSATWNYSPVYPSQEFLMGYHLLTASLGYNTGYTFIFDVGRLSFSAGISGSVNKALYDDSYVPFELLIYKYHNAWQMSNKLSFGVQWDGRDYTINTTKGYVVSASATYAGGFLRGLSNYIKIGLNASTYTKIAELGPEDNRKNLMFCLSSNASAMLPQYYKHDEYGTKWHDPKLGATKYEMLYIDGMSVARGHNTRLDLALMWDNKAEISYPLVDNLLQAEMFVSATGVKEDLKIWEGLDWYFSAGIGAKLKVSGFPLGLYLTKTACKLDGSAFTFLDGSLFHSTERPGSGISLVLAISSSLI